VPGRLSPEEGALKAISGAATAVLISVWLKVPAEVLASWWADAEEDGGPAARGRRPAHRHDEHERTRNHYHGSRGDDGVSAAAAESAEHFGHKAPSGVYVGKYQIGRNGT